MAAMGVWVCGITAAVATFYCYGIGGYLGIPLGFAIGIFLSVKVRAADVLFVVGVSVGSWVLLYEVVPVPRNDPMGEFLYEALPPVAGAAVAVLVFATRNMVPPTPKKIVGAALCLALATWGVVSYLIHIYS